MHGVVKNWPASGCSSLWRFRMKWHKNQATGANRSVETRRPWWICVRRGSWYGLRDGERRVSVWLSFTPRRGRSCCSSFRFPCVGYTLVRFYKMVRTCSQPPSTIMPYIHILRSTIKLTVS